MFARVVQCGDGSDDAATRTRTSSGSSEQRTVATAPAGSARLRELLPCRDPARYEILEEHGRGGLGRVFRARDKKLGRDVALKELLSRSATTELRFMREALITSRLEHPGIVRVHESGRWPDGTPFYTMKLVAGRPLKALIDSCTSFSERRALLPHLIAVADAVAYAHDRKIIHRDLKPSNIIVGDAGDTVVIDWGLAKEIPSTLTVDRPDERPFCAVVPAGGHDGVSMAGTIVGTPAYMSPEQARGDAVDERTDVFAIGAILRELCGGVRPPPDLATIVANATAAGPEARYRNARELGRDLRAFDRGAPLFARHHSLLDVARHWRRFCGASFCRSIPAPLATQPAL